MSVEWFNWYCQQISKSKNYSTYRENYICPCCFLPTLSSRNEFDICPVCFWEDDGQDSDDADMVRGGPNKDYSLTEARLNFEKYGTMYRIEDKKGFAVGMAAAERSADYREAVIKAVNSGTIEDWKVACSAKEEIYQDDEEDLDGT